jgi:hypothetical protein
MNRGRVGEERGGKETDGCPLTAESITRSFKSPEGSGTMDWEIVKGTTRNLSPT